jgi:hypothetical protein
MLLEVEARVEDRRRVARIFLAEDADCFGETIGGLPVRLVAMRATHIAVHRHAAFENEAPPKVCARGRCSVCCGRDRGKRLEIRFRVFQRLLGVGTLRRRLRERGDHGSAAPCETQKDQAKKYRPSHFGHLFQPVARDAEGDDIPE